MFKAIGEPTIVCFFLVEGFSMMSLSSALEPMRSANRLLGRTAYEWHLCSAEGRRVKASNGIALDSMPVHPLVRETHAIFVCGGIWSKPGFESTFAPALRSAARRGTTIGALSTGTQLLAKAGLLDGYRCTIHWENLASLAETFPLLNVTSKLYEIDRDRITCAGGTAAMDMMLRIISDHHGLELAHSIANQFHHRWLRGQDEDQRGGRLQRLHPLPPPLSEAVRLMKENLEHPMRLDAIGARVKMSSRQLERLFRRHLGETPGRYYLALRIDRARELLLYTDRPMIDIALAAGFSSASRFSSWFRHFEAKRPSVFRMESRGLTG